MCRSPPAGEVMVPLHVFLFLIAQGIQFYVTKGCGTNVCFGEGRVCCLYMPKNNKQYYVLAAMLCALSNLILAIFILNRRKKMLEILHKH